MGKLIDAERFKNEDLVFSDGHISDDLKLYVKYAEVVEAIEKAPAVDAVPVVRCKDCRYFEDAISAEDDPWCGAISLHTSEDDYCSWGERREDG